MNIHQTLLKECLPGVTLEHSKKLCLLFVGTSIKRFIKTADINVAGKLPEMNQVVAC